MKFRIFNDSDGALSIATNRRPVTIGAHDIKDADMDAFSAMAVRRRESNGAPYRIEGLSPAARYALEFAQYPRRYDPTKAPADNTQDVDLVAARKAVVDVPPASLTIDPERTVPTPVVAPLQGSVEPNGDADPYAAITPTSGLSVPAEQGPSDTTTHDRTAEVVAETAHKLNKVLGGDDEDGERVGGKRAKTERVRVKTKKRS